MSQLLSSQTRNDAAFRQQVLSPRRQGEFMKNMWLCLCLLSASVMAFSQSRKSAPESVGTSPEAKICQQPYQVQEQANGWPEGPVHVLFHREDSKSSWLPNPAIHIPGLEAVAGGSAKTLVCVQESQVEVGHYESGEPGYAPSWQVILVRLADNKAYFTGGTGIVGEMPPYIKWKRGAGVGKAPTEIFERWLRLMVDQKVARLKLRLRPRESYAVSAMAFSSDGTKLVVAQEPRYGSSGMPPAPINVFDMVSGQLLASMQADYSTHSIALSRSGTTIATENQGQLEIWDSPSGKVVQKPEMRDVASLLFGPDDMLGVAGGDKAQVWDIAGNRALNSAAGSQVQLSPEGAWIAVNNTADGIKVQAMESGKEIGRYPHMGERDKYLVSRDGRAMAAMDALSAGLYFSGDPDGHPLELPNLGVNMISAMSATRDGFVIGNGDGIMGLVSGVAHGPRSFATDMIGIKTIAVSSDGKLIAAGNSFGAVEVWELR
jgi:hypothetical protein